jgi:DNA polymerase III delta prime subunit
MAATINTAFWCSRVQTCMSMFAEKPHTLQHLLLFGPPGSGKTTSAAWLVEKIWGGRKSLMSISMNAADERSLESIRNKVFPFLRVDWRTSTEAAPRFLILDECETLTEAAQLSLQTILDMDPTDVCVILICNSQSRIHPKLRQRLLRIRYDPPRNSEKITDIFSILTRGDLRLTSKKSNVNQRIWNYLNCHEAEIESSILQDDTIDIQTILIEIILLGQTLHILNDTLMSKINAIYPLIVDGTMLFEEINTIMIDILKTFRNLVRSSV